MGWWRGLSLVVHRSALDVPLSLLALQENARLHNAASSAGDLPRSCQPSVTTGVLTVLLREGEDVTDPAEVADTWSPTERRPEYA